MPAHSLTPDRSSNASQPKRTRSGRWTIKNGGAKGERGVPTPFSASVPDHADEAGKVRLRVEAETASPSTDQDCTDTSGVASVAKTGKSEIGQAVPTQDGDNSTKEDGSTSMDDLPPEIRLRCLARERIRRGLRGDLRLGTDGVIEPYTDDSDSTDDSDVPDDSVAEDLTIAVSNHEGDAIHNSTVDPGGPGNAGERSPEHPAGLASTGPDSLQATQLAAVSPQTVCSSDDPMDWTVDDVVRNLSHELSPALPQPDGDALAEALKREGVNGSILLCQTTMSIVREDLGIRNLGRAAAIVRLIDVLRQRSDGYRATAYYTVPHGIIPEYAAGRARALERRRRRLCGEDSSEYGDAIDATERIEQLEAELKEARSALASREPLDSAGDSPPRKRRRLSGTGEGDLKSSELRELRCIMLAQSKAICQLGRDVSYLREGQR